MDTNYFVLHPVIIVKRIGNRNILGLLENKDDLINTENYMGRTPLFVACMHGHVKKIKWLIDKGAYVNAKNKCNIIPRGINLHGLFIQTYDEKMKVKLYTSLMASQNLATIRMLILAGADINLTDTDGNTALMLFEKESWEEGVAELVKAAAYTKKTKIWHRFFNN